MINLNELIQKSLKKWGPYSLIAFVMMCNTSYAQEIVCPVTADNSIASYGGDSKNPSERRENVGSDKRVKMKGRENQAIMKFDLSKIPANKSILKAVLKLKLETPELAIRQVGYSTIPMNWIEGKGAKAGVGNKEYSCHNYPGGKGNSWGRKGGTILEVIHGNGGNVNGWVLAEKKGDSYELELPGRVVEALMKDQKGGLILLDESGWWSGERSNIYINSRESKFPPTLTVTVGKADKKKPGEPSIKKISDDVDDGQMLLEITCSGDDGNKGMALGYDIKYSENKKISKSNWKDAIAVPRYLVKRPKVSGTVIKFWLNGLKPGASYDIGIQAYDESGNRSKIVSTGLVKASGPTSKPNLKVKDIKISKGSPLDLKDLQVWSVDELLKVDPVSGNVLDGIQYIDTKHREGNITWDGKNKAVSLFGAKSEIVSFRLALELTKATSLKKVSIAPMDLKMGKEIIAAKNISVRRDWYAKSGKNWFSNALPLINEKNKGVFSIPANDQKIDGQKIQSVYVSIAIPKGSKAGDYQGSLAININGKISNVPVHLKVYNVTIPDKLSFIIELNSYGVSSKGADAKKRFHATHRLANEFRLGYNTLGYSHSGNESVPFIPAIEGVGKDAKVKDWSKWNEWMGPLLDGSAFKGLPREGTPIPQFYLPFYESYPTKIYKEYAGGKFHDNKHVPAGEKWNRDKWRFFLCKNDVFVADGFSNNWKAAAKSVALDYRKHFESKGWTGTEFQIFANNKLYGRNKAKKTTTSLWTLDEPSFGRDFRALNFLYETFSKPFVGTKLNVITRGDVSRPMWQGDRLDGNCDVSVISSAIYSSQDLLQRRVHELGDAYWFYGGGKGMNTDLSQIPAVYIKNWTFGCVGGLAYWTSFHGNDWDEDDTLAVVLSGRHGYTSSSVPTGRVTAQRRVQQDIELLNLLKNKSGWSFRRVRSAVLDSLVLDSKVVRKHADDPGTTQIAGVRSKNLANVRKAVLELLAK